MRKVLKMLADIGEKTVHPAQAVMTLTVIYRPRKFAGVNKRR